MSKQTTAGAGTKKQVLINVDLKQVYKQGLKCSDIELSDVEQVIYNYFTEKLEQDNYRNTLNEFQLNITKKCIDNGYITKKDNINLIAGKYVFIAEKSIKKALLKLNLAGVDKKFKHTIKSDVSKAGNCYIKSTEFDVDYIKEKQEKTLTEKQEQAKKEKQEKRKKLAKIAEFNLDTLNDVKAGKNAVDNIIDLIDDDKKNELRISLLEQEFNKQDNKAIKTSLLSDDGKFNNAYIVLKTSEFKRLLKLEQEFHLLKKAGSTAGTSKATATAEISTETK